MRSVVLNTLLIPALSLLATCAGAPSADIAHGVDGSNDGVGHAVIEGYVGGAVEPVVIETPSNDPDCTPKGCGTVDSRDPDYTSEVFEGLLAAWQNDPIGESTEALDTLLFHTWESAEYVELLGTDSLDAEHATFLKQELAKSVVDVEMRLVDEHGALRGHMTSEGVPLKEKQHLVFADTGSLKRFEASGKVKRVGLHHLWSRW